MVWYFFVRILLWRRCGVRRYLYGIDLVLVWYSHSNLCYLYSIGICILLVMRHGGGMALVCSWYGIGMALVWRLGGIVTL